MNPNTAFKTNKALSTISDRESIDIRNFKSITLYCGNCGMKRFLDTTRIDTLTAHKTYKCPECNQIRWAILTARLKS